MRRIYNAIAISLTAILMACTHPEQGIRVETVEVRVPVATPCVDKNAVPAEPSKVGDKLNGNAAHDADLLASSAITLRQWGKELTALISPCLKP